MATLLTVGVSLVFLILVAVVKAPIFPAKSSNTTESVIVPSAKLLKSTPVICSLRLLIVPEPLIAIPPSELEKV